MGGNQAYDMTATNPAQTMITYSTQELAADNVEQPVEDISGATFEAEPVAPTVKKSKVSSCAFVLCLQFVCKCNHINSDVT